MTCDIIWLKNKVDCSIRLCTKNSADFYLAVGRWRDVTLVIETMSMIRQKFGGI